MREEKKKYLKNYLLQETKIERLERMCLLNPENIEKYKDEITKADNLRINIENSISQVKDPVLCELLYLKYVLGKTLEEIALTLNYSKRHIERLHIKALEQFEINCE